MKQYQKNDNSYKDLLELAKNLAEDLESGLKLSCDKINQSCSELIDVGYSFYDEEYTLFYKPKERSFIIFGGGNNSGDSLKSTFDLIRIFPKDSPRKYDYSDELYGPGLFDYTFLFDNHDNFNQENPLIVKNGLFENKENLYSIILASLLSYNQVVSYFFKETLFENKQLYYNLLDRKLAIYTPLLDKENKEFCFISYLKFITEFRDYFLDYFNNRTFELKDCLENNNQDEKEVIRILLGEDFEEDFLNQLISEISLNEGGYLVYKKEVYHNMLLITKSYRERILNKILEELKSNSPNTLKERIENVDFDLVGYIKNTLSIEIDSIDKYASGFLQNSYKKLSDQLIQYIHFICFGCGIVDNDKERILLNIDLTQNKKEQLKEFLELFRE